MSDKIQVSAVKLEGAEEHNVGNSVETENDNSSRSNSAEKGYIDDNGTQRLGNDEVENEKGAEDQLLDNVSNSIEGKNTDGCDDHNNSNSVDTCYNTGRHSTLGTNFMNVVTTNETETVAPAVINCLLNCHIDETLRDLIIKKLNPFAKIWHSYNSCKQKTISQVVFDIHLKKLVEKSESLEEVKSYLKKKEKKYTIFYNDVEDENNKENVFFSFCEQYFFGDQGNFQELKQAKDSIKKLTKILYFCDPATGETILFALLVGNNFLKDELLVGDNALKDEKSKKNWKNFLKDELLVGDNALKDEKSKKNWKNFFCRMKLLRYFISNGINLRHYNQDKETVFEKMKHYKQSNQQSNVIITTNIKMILLEISRHIITGGVNSLQKQFFKICDEMEILKNTDEYKEHEDKYKKHEVQAKSLMEKEKLKSMLRDDWAKFYESKARKQLYKMHKLNSFYKGYQSPDARDKKRRPSKQQASQIKKALILHSGHSTGNLKRVEALPDDVAAEYVNLVDTLKLLKHPDIMRKMTNLQASSLFYIQHFIKTALDGGLAGELMSLLNEETFQFALATIDDVEEGLNETFMDLIHAAMEFSDPGGEKNEDTLIKVLKNFLACGISVKHDDEIVDKAVYNGFMNIPRILIKEGAYISPNACQHLLDQMKFRSYHDLDNETKTGDKIDHVIKEILFHGSALGYLNKKLLSILLQHAVKVSGEVGGNRLENQNKKIINKFLRTTDVFGRTALHYAAMYGHPDTIKLICHYGTEEILHLPDLPFDIYANLRDEKIPELKKRNSMNDSKQKITEMNPIPKIIENKENLNHVIQSHWCKGFYTSMGYTPL
jgi:hypothetical protein